MDMQQLLSGLKVDLGIRAEAYDGRLRDRLQEAQERLTAEGITLEDTTGSVECITFKYDDVAESVVEDAIVKVKGKFEHGDRGNQIIVYEAETLELSEEAARPVQFELHVPSSDFNQERVQRLNRILASYPGRDYVVIFVLQSDGRKFRAELPVTVDSRNAILRSELQDLFGAPVWA